MFIFPFVQNVFPAFCIFFQLICTHNRSIHVHRISIWIFFKHLFIPLYKKLKRKKTVGYSQKLAVGLHFLLTCFIIKNRLLYSLMFLMQYIRFFSIAKYLINTRKLNLVTTRNRKFNLSTYKPGELTNINSSDQ